MIKQNNRKHYKRPQVSQIKLETEDAVLGNCKSTTGVTTGAKNDTICNTSPLCRDTYGS